MDKDLLDWAKAINDAVTMLSTCAPGGIRARYGVEIATNALRRIIAK